MTYEETLEFAKGGLSTYLEEYPHLTKQIEFQKVVIDALEKQVPKKPNTVEGYHYYCFKCPTCNEYVRIYQDNGYCLSCGQNLDWSDYE